MREDLFQKSNKMRGTLSTSEMMLCSFASLSDKLNATEKEERIAVYPVFTLCLSQWPVQSVLRANKTCLYMDMSACI